MRDLADGNGQQALIAQQLAHLPRGIAFENAFAFPSSRVDGGVFECTHAKEAMREMRCEMERSDSRCGAAQSSRVTRSTSSIVVTPERILARPSSRMLGVIVRA